MLPVNATLFLVVLVLVLILSIFFVFAQLKLFSIDKILKKILKELQERQK